MNIMANHPKNLLPASSPTLISLPGGCDQHVWIGLRCHRARDASRDIRQSAIILGLGGPLGHVADTEPVELALAIDSVTEGVAVTGRVSGIMHLSCSRCLIGYDRSFTQMVDETYYYGGGEDHDGYDVVDNRIDLEPMPRDVIMLAFPLRPL